jgi:hypothetical protein
MAMTSITRLMQNLRRAAATALIGAALAACVSSSDRLQGATAHDGPVAPEHFQRDPAARPDVFAIKWGEIQPTEGYARVEWHPLTGKEGAVIFVEQAPARMSGADIAATWATVCPSGNDDDDEPPKPGIVVQFRASAAPRLAQITRERMNGFLAVLAECKVLSFARVEWDVLPSRLKICLDAASEQQAASLARVLAGKPPSG